MVLNIKEFEELKCELKSLMGNHFVDPLDWQLTYDKSFSAFEKKKMANFPWSLEFLKSDCPFEKGMKIYQSHFLFWGHPVSIPYFVDKFPAYNERMFMFNEEKENELFNRRGLDSVWYLMPIRLYGIVDDKVITFSDHIKMIPENYELASAVEETAKQIFIKQRTGRFANELSLFPTEVEGYYFNPLYKEDKSLEKFIWGSKSFDLSRILMARCSDITKSGCNIVVTSLDKANGLSILPIGEQQDVLSLALSLKRKT